MILKNFQIEAVNKLISRSRELLCLRGEKRIIFKSPTGSGKTIIMAEYLNRIVKDKENNCNYSAWLYRMVLRTI